MEKNIQLCHPVGILLCSCLCTFICCVVFLRKSRSSKLFLLLWKQAEEAWILVNSWNKLRQILNKLFLHVTLCTIWKVGSTITGRQSKRMWEAHRQREAWQEVTINAQTVLLFSSTRKNPHPLNLKKIPQSKYLSTYIIIHVFEEWRITDFRNLILILLIIPF